MTDLVVRRLLIDLNAPFAVRWNGGDAFRTALFNALSMSFPVGEQYFIDSVRAGIKTLPPASAQPMAAEVAAFVGQEATHRRIHALFNDQLAAQGFVNRLEDRARARIQANAHHDARTHVGATAATEHITAIFAEWLLRHPEAFDGAEARLRDMWLWHGAEESEHCSTAFDVYRLMGGNDYWRVRIFYMVTWFFLTDILRQTVRNLWHDGSLFKWSTWRSAAGFLFGRDGMIRGNYASWHKYRAAGFHPRQQDTALSAQWLRDNATQYSVVGQ